MKSKARTSDFEDGLPLYSNNDESYLRISGQHIPVRNGWAGDVLLARMAGPR